MDERKLLFLLGCIPTRLLIAYLSKICPPVYLPILGTIALLPASGFMYLYVNGLRTSGLGVFEKIWWHPIRPVHAIFYYLFAYYAIIKSKNAWMFLLVDALFGLIAFILYHSLYDRDDVEEHVALSL